MIIIIIIIIIISECIKYSSISSQQERQKYSLTARHFKFKTSFYGTYFSIVIFLEENWQLRRQSNKVTSTLISQKKMQATLCVGYVVHKAQTRLF